MGLENKLQRQIGEYNNIINVVNVVNRLQFIVLNQLIPHLLQRINELNKVPEILFRNFLGISEHIERI